MTTTRWISLALITLMLAACYLPWFDQPAAALRSGLLDTAEWITLSSAARASAPPLLASLPLRLTLGLAIVLLVWEIALVRAARLRLAFGAVALVALITLFPPFEFFTGGSADPNYRQQALVFAITLVGIGLAPVVVRDTRSLLRLGLLVLIGGCGIWGVAEGISFYREFALPAAPGFGAVVFHVALALVFISRVVRPVPSGGNNEKPE